MSDTARLQQLESKVAQLDEVVRRMTEQTVALSNAVLERAKKDEVRAKKDEVRMAMLEAYRVVHTLGRASHFFPKTRTVIFVGRPSFGDNVKYAYLAFLEAARGRDIRCLFLPYDNPQWEQLKAAGLPCMPPQVGAWMVDDAKTVLGAAVAVICDNFHPHYGVSPTPFALLQGARHVQLWHGIPLKEIGLQHVFAPGGHKVFLSEILGSSGFFDVLVGPSAASKSEWQRSFAFREFAPVGFARNDVLLREPTANDLINVDRGTFDVVRNARANGKTVIIYGPTFRDHIGPDWFEKSGIIPVASECRAEGHEFIVNLHPFEQGATEELRRRYPQLRFVDPHTDVYPIVKYTDIFLTDYSSLAFDVLHIDCPLVFYRPDHAEYMARARALIPGREGYTPGEMVADPASLARAIKTAIEARRSPDKDTHKAARQALRQKLFDHHDAKAGERLAGILMQQVDAAMKESGAGEKR